MSEDINDLLRQVLEKDITVPDAKTVLLDLLSQALQKRDEETLAKVKSLVMGYDTKDGYTQLYDQVIEHVYDQLLSTLTTK